MTIVLNLQETIVNEIREEWKCTFPLAKHVHVFMQRIYLMHDCS